MKTIKQIADEIGVSKTAIRKKMPPEVRESHTETIDGIIYISPAGEELIKQGFSHRTGNQSKPVSDEVISNFPGGSGNDSGNQFAVVSEDSANPETVSANQFPGADLIEVLREQLNVKDQQLKEKDQQLHELTAALENTTAALKAAQVLHAGTMNNRHLIVEAEQAEPEPGSQATQEQEPTPAPKPQPNPAAATRSAAPPERNRPQGQKRPVNRRKGLLDWFSNRS